MLIYIVIVIFRTYMANVDICHNFDVVYMYTYVYIGTYAYHKYFKFPSKENCTMYFPHWGPNIYFVNMSRC